jgi:hypothetical protein
MKRGGTLSWATLAFLGCHSAHASPLSDLAGSLQPGQWAQLATSNIDPTLTGTQGASGFTFGYADKGVWDPISRQFFFIGSDHSPVPAIPRFVSFTESTNRWQILPTPAWFPSNLTGTAMHGYQHTTLDVAGRALYHRPYGQTVIHALNLTTGAWSDLPANGAVGYNSCCVGVEYFPERGSITWASVENGNLGGLTEFRNGNWGRVGLANIAMGALHNFALYSPVHKVVVFGGGNGSSDVYRLSASGTVDTMGAAPVSLAVQTSVQTVDPVSGNLIILDDSQHLRSYNPVTDTWVLHTGTPSIFTGPNNSPAVHGIVAAPVSNHGVVMFVKCAQSGTTCTVWLYKHAAGTGADLMAPSAPVQLEVHE